MYSYPFSYHRPGSIDEALTMLADFGDDGKMIAGGQSLLPAMKLRLAAPGHLVDITRIPELGAVRETSGGVEIGALVTHRQVASDAAISAHAGLLAEIANVVGDLQVRNLGTIGGTLAHADPAADYPAGVLALDAEIVARGPDGERTIPVSEFFLGLFTTALEPNEIVTSVRVADLPARTGYRYEKLANPASGYALVGVAAVVRLDDSGAIAEARIGITGASDVAWRPQSVESALVGATPDDATLRAAAASAIDGREMLADVHAPADYRARVTRNLVRRAVLTAASRAQG
ncbi:MAG TPA: xanthine dehydrogenase family protein subunit M [Thermomicrobiales bacterium]|nr:xanthine dehydrogenase family protein subunit M [Thermomicrobiales bacterium]